MSVLIEENHDFDYVVVLGDLVGHNDWEVTEQEKADNNQFVLDQIRATFWSGKDKDTRDASSPVILPVVGNHEGSPLNYENYDDPDDFIHKKIYKAFEPIIDSQKISDLVKKAFYVHRDEARNIKFISLDSNINSLFNMHCTLNPANPLNILTNLMDTLYESEKRGEAVVMLTHISLADYTSQTVLVRFLNLIIERFQDTLKTSLTAHSHKDQLKFFKDQKGENIMVEYFSPSLTTYTDRNPEYRVYHFSGSGEVKDYDQYKFNLDVMNIFADQGNLVFDYDHSYSLLSEYEVTVESHWGKIRI